MESIPQELKFIYSSISVFFNKVFMKKKNYSVDENSGELHIHCKIQIDEDEVIDKNFTFKLA